VLLNLSFIAEFSHKDIPKWDIFYGVLPRNKPTFFDISNPNHVPSHKYNLFCSTRSIDDGCSSKENGAIECRLLWFSTVDG
jgi:hypothetical protein